MRCFTYTRDACFSGKFLPMLFPAGILSYTHCAILCGEFVLHSLSCFMRGECLTHLVLCYVGNLSYIPGLFYVGILSDTPYSILYEEFVLHILCYFMWGVSYMPHAVLCGEFLLHTTCCFTWGVSLSCPVLILCG